MTLTKIAKAAGVSISTVSRVVNAEPGVADSTAELVREAMRSMDFAPSRQKRANHWSDAGSARGKRVAFYVLAGRKSPTPAYDHLLRGVSAASHKFGIDLTIGFMDDPEAALEQIAERHPDGLLLHGLCPPEERAQALHDIPTVWLLGNVIRPTWGDLVMPDNIQIGRIAAQYLLGRGHRRSLYYGLNIGWSLAVRAIGFASAVNELGGTATLLNPQLPKDFANLEATLDRLVEAFRAPNPPTGLFVGEDWLLRHVYDAMGRAGIRPEADVDIISCNYDLPHLMGINPKPATIDIRFEQIAQRGVERLAARMRQDESEDRVTMMLEPRLVTPAEITSASPV